MPAGVEQGPSPDFRGSAFAPQDGLEPPENMLEQIQAFLTAPCVQPGSFRNVNKMSGKLQQDPQSMSSSVLKCWRFFPVGAGPSVPGEEKGSATLAHCNGGTERLWQFGQLTRLLLPSSDLQFDWLPTSSAERAKHICTASDLGPASDPTPRQPTSASFIFPMTISTILIRGAAKASQPLPSS